MYHHAVQLLIRLFAKLQGVAPYGIGADEEVAADFVSGGVVKGDDVGVIVMVQILAVYFQYLLIVAKNIGNVAQRRP